MKDKIRNRSSVVTLQQLANLPHQSDADAALSATPVYDLPNESTFAIVHRTLMRMIATREMSAQEATLDALNMPLIEYSRCFISIIAIPPDRVRLQLKPSWMRRNLRSDASGYEIFYRTKIYKYIFRTYITRLLALFIQILFFQVLLLQHIETRIML